MTTIATLKKGSFVRLRCAGGRASEGVVWEDHGDVVMVCGRAQYERLRDGYKDVPMPIGFKREDVRPVGERDAK